jgi:hypothetical protein
MLHDLVPDRGSIAAQQWRRRARSRSIQVALIAECFDATAGASKPDTVTQCDRLVGGPSKARVFDL